jgi:hypothetical protein
MDEVWLPGGQADGRLWRSIIYYVVTECWRDVRTAFIGQSTAVSVVHSTDRARCAGVVLDQQEVESNKLRTGPVTDAVDYNNLWLSDV